VVAADGVGDMASVTIDFGTSGTIRLIPKFSQTLTKL
jgi:DNA helicase-2/ATP-dependent DNA helicase PcrA